LNTNETTTEVKVPPASGTRSGKGNYQGTIKVF
jgi:hypothetical protein